MHQLSSKSFCGKWYTFFIAHDRCRSLKGFTYDWNAKEKDVGGFFLIQTSSHMLSINKTDLPLTASVINPFELLIIFFLLLFSVKGNTFFSSHNMVAFTSTAWKFKIFEDIIWFDIHNMDSLTKAKSKVQTQLREFHMFIISGCCSHILVSSW